MKIRGASLVVGGRKDAEQEGKETHGRDSASGDVCEQGEQEGGKKEENICGVGQSLSFPHGIHAVVNQSSAPKRQKAEAFTCLGFFEKTLLNRCVRLANRETDCAI